MAAKGSRLPQKGSTEKRTREALEGVAFQIGMVVAVERNRAGWNQTELAERVGGGAVQSSITRIENGKSGKLKPPQVTKLFRVLKMDSFKRQREFLKWWQ
jgi:ribosome-binding protein aMBF1 (putative translation factor)